MSRLLEVNDLNVEFNSYSRSVYAVRGASFHVDKQEVVAIVGESGCGKSVTAKSIMQLLPSQTCKIKKGSILFEGKDLTKLSKKEMAKYRGCKVSMVFQDPMTSLNPTMRVGDQIAESMIIHKGVSKRTALKAAEELIKLVGIANPEQCIRKYPHQLSGGMRQRIVIAMAIVCQPALLIADEPTTALDVTIQAQILKLLKELQEKMGMSILLITHDLGVVANFADRVVVMYAGKVVEKGTVQDIFYHPKHPYTKGLLQSVPRLDHDKNDELSSIEGTPPDLSFQSQGCAFASRCPYVMDVCDQYDPSKTEISHSHHANCWLLDPRAPKVDLNESLDKASND